MEAPPPTTSPWSSRSQKDNPLREELTLTRDRAHSPPIPYPLSPIPSRKELPVSKLLKAAIEGLHINVPIYRTEEQDGVLILYLYGGRVVRWPPSTMATDLPSGSADLVTTSPPTPSSSAPPLPRSPASPTDDLTAIPGIGKATAKALNDAGLSTFQALAKATDSTLLTVPNIHALTITNIRTYLRNR